MSVGEQNPGAKNEAHLSPILLDSCWDVTGYHGSGNVLEDIILGTTLLNWSEVGGRWGRNRIGEEGVASIIQRRDSIRDAAGLVSGEFKGQYNYRTALEGINSFQHHLPGADTDELKLTARKLGEQVELRRLRDYGVQVDQLNDGIMQEQDGVWVRVVSVLEGNHSYFIARLNSFFLDSGSEGEPIPGLLLEDKDGAVGIVPENARTFGAYFGRSFSKG
jgi:hypothetical protein